MSYSVKTIPHFDRQAKLLARKYPSFRNELSDLMDSLENEPAQGIALGDDCYKIRISIKSKRKGKSGGARVITHVVAIRENVYLLTVFDKSKKETISDKELQELIKMIE